MRNVSALHPGRGQGALADAWWGRGQAGPQLSSCSQRLTSASSPLHCSTLAWRTGACLEVKGAEFSPGEAAAREGGSRTLLPTSQAMAPSWTARGRDSGSTSHPAPCCPSTRRKMLADGLGPSSGKGSTHVSRAWLFPTPTAKCVRAQRPQPSEAGSCWTHRGHRSEPEKSRIPRLSLQARYTDV